MAKNSLVIKLTKVLNAASKVKKSGYNTFQKYHYITEGDLLEAIREEIAKLGIFIFSSIEEVATREVGDKKDFITTVKIRYTFVDGESGESQEVVFFGEGTDKQDKGIYKAITGANKYFLLKTFMLSGDDDPEKDETVKSTTLASESKKKVVENTTPKKSIFGGKPKGIKQDTTPKTVMKTKTSILPKKEVEDDEDLGF